MSDSVIQVENLGKRYRIRHQQQGGMRYKALRDVLTDRTKSVARRLWSLTARNPQSAIRNPQSEDFWALKGVSFEVKQAETLGIVGRNGAGKSTLLKILSRITEPTEGRVRMRGRVASLLEVGTGFHPELTGRENIFLNGAILGMSRAEIKEKFDEIVAFAEVEKFLDTPVKRYSSGMYVRLAFSVAAHLEPEILIIDEVLAVGDAQFQKKCLGKMGEVAKGGRTVLFVSHNMAAVASLCSRAVLLEQGRFLRDGTPESVVANYMQSLRRNEQHFVPTHCFKGPHFRHVSLRKGMFGFGDSVTVNMDLYSPVDALVAVEVEVHSATGIPIIYCSTAPMHGKLIPLRAEVSKKVQLEIGPLPLATGEYFMHLWLIKPWVENYHVLSQPLPFTVNASDPGQCGFEFRQDYNRGALTVPLSIIEVSA